MEPFKALVAAAALAATTAAQAGFVTAPVTAIADRPGYLSSTATATINQTDLASNYGSGVTDFDSYVATTTASGNNFSDIYIPNDLNSLARLTYGFGAAVTLDSIAVWNNTVSRTGGPDAITGFHLYADNDDNFANGTTADLGQFAMRLAGAGATLADVFSFTSTTTSFMHFQITGGQAGLRPGINELVFGSASVVQGVPEPGSLALAGLGLMLAAGRLRRR